MIGVESNSASEVDLPFASVSVNSGALLPTRGAPCEAGNHLAAIRVVKTNNPIISRLKPASKELPIFTISERSGANARRIPTKRKAAAIMQRIRLAQGKSRVIGKVTKKNG